MKAAAILISVTILLCNIYIQFTTADYEDADGDDDEDNDESELKELECFMLNGPINWEHVPFSDCKKKCLSSKLNFVECTFSKGCVCSDSA